MVLFDKLELFYTDVNPHTLYLGTFYAKDENNNVKKIIFMININPLSFPDDFIKIDSLNNVDNVYEFLLRIGVDLNNIPITDGYVNISKLSDTKFNAYTEMTMIDIINQIIDNFKSYKLVYQPITNITQQQQVK